MTKNNTIKILLPVVAVLIAVVAVVSFNKEQGTDSYQKDSDNYYGIKGIKGSNVYDRTNKVFGLSLNYQL